MDAEIIIIAAAGSLITLLLAMVAYFLNRLINQIDGLAGAVSQLDKNMALHVERFTALKEQLAEHVQTIAGLRKQLVTLRKLYQDMVQKYEVLEKGVNKFDEWLNNQNK